MAEPLLEAARLRWKSRVQDHRAQIALCQGNPALAIRRSTASLRFWRHAVRLEREALPMPAWMEVAR